MLPPVPACLGWLPAVGHVPFAPWQVPHAAWLEPPAHEGFVLDPPVRVLPWQYRLEQEIEPPVDTVVPVLLEVNEYGDFIGVKES